MFRKIGLILSIVICFALPGRAQALQLELVSACGSRTVSDCIGQAGDPASVYISCEALEASSFLKDLGALCSRSSSGSTVAFHRSGGDLFFHAGESSHAGSPKKGRGYLMQDEKTYIPLAEFLEGMGIHIGEISGSRYVLYPILQNPRMEGGGTLRFTFRTSLPARAEIRPSGNGDQALFLENVFVEEPFSLDMNGDFAIRCAAGSGPQAKLTFPAGWKPYLFRGDGSVWVEFIPEHPRTSGYRWESLVQYDGTGDGSVHLNFTGPVRYLWTLDRQHGKLSVDFVMTDLAHNFSVPENAEILFSQAGSRAVRLSLPVKEGHRPQFRSPTGSELVIGFAAGEPQKFSGGDFTGKPVKTAVIVLDPGHGGGDPGACNGRLGLREKDITLSISLLLAEKLESLGWTVLLTRDGDRDVTWAYSPDRLELQARADVANFNEAAVFVSIHCNASTLSSVNGFSVYWYKDADGGLARSFDRPLRADVAHRGIIRNNFYVLRNTRMPAVLVETAFISNMQDARKLGDPAFRNLLAEDLADAIHEYMMNRHP